MFWVTGDSIYGYDVVYPIASITNATTLLLNTLAQGNQHAFPSELTGTGVYNIASCAQVNGSLMALHTLSTKNGMCGNPETDSNRLPVMRLETKALT